MRHTVFVCLMSTCLVHLHCSNRNPASLPDGQPDPDAAVGDGSVQIDSTSVHADGGGQDSVTPADSLAQLDQVAPCNAVQTDSFTQQLNRKVDILFLIDPSGSMMDEKPRLLATAPIFATAATTNKLSFHLGSISIVKPYSGGQTLGQLHGDPRFITPSTPDLQGEFKERVDMPMGGGDENGFDALLAALSPALSGTVNPSSCASCTPPNFCESGGCRAPNWGFRRSDASLELLVFSDEDDASSASVAATLAALKALTSPKQGRFVRVHALLPSASCMPNVSFPRWKNLVASTGGTEHDLCATSYNPAITTLASRIFGLQDQFFLSQAPQSGSIKVKVDGKAVAAADFTYDAGSNSITLTTAAPDGSVVAVSYVVSCP